MNTYELINSLCNQWEFEIKACTKAKHGENWVEHESKNDYDIWIVTEGEITIEMEDRTSLLKKGDVFLFYPEKLYLAHSGGDECEFIYIHFGVTLGKNIRPISSFMFDGFTSADAISSELKIFFNYYRLYEERQFISTLALKAVLILLFSKIVKHKIDNYKSKKSEDNPSYLKIENILSYITKNIHKPMSVKELSEYACMSEKYFITFFKGIIGITPYVYINKLKLTKAFEYLSQRKYSVKETADLLGYSDQYVFSKAFKRYYGYSPKNIKNCF